MFEIKPVHRHERSGRAVIGSKYQALRFGGGDGGAVAIDAKRLT